MSRRAVVIPFPAARVRRVRRVAVDVFAPLREVAALEQAHQRFFWFCAAATALVSAAFALGFN